MTAPVIDQPSKLPVSLLPDLPSALLRVALADFDRVRRMPERFQIRMKAWHEAARPNFPCQVCLAGAVMAMTLGAPDTSTLEAHSYMEVPVRFRDNTDDLRSPSVDLCDKLMAINYMRCGLVSWALWILKLRANPNERKYDLPAILYMGNENADEDGSSIEWRTQMEQLIAMLEHDQL